MLKAAGIPLYRHLNVHGYWTLGATRSRSRSGTRRGAGLKEKYGNDAFRYFVLREMVFGLDADFSEEGFVTRLKRRPGERPRQPGLARDDADREPGAGVVPAAGDPTVAENDDRRRVGAGPRRGRARDGRVRLPSALTAVWEFVATLNRSSTPSSRGRSRRRRRRPGACRRSSTRSPSRCGSSASYWRRSCPTRPARSRGARSERRAEARRRAMGRLAAGTPVQKLSGLFPRVDDKKPATAASAQSAPAAAARTIKIDDFGKVELRVAEVVAAEPVRSRRSS